MKTSLRAAIVSAIFSFTSFAFFTSQAQTSRLSVAINTSTTNFHYENTSVSLAGYKKNFKGFQAGFSYQAGISPLFSVVPELYFAIKGGSLKENNPLTQSKTTLRLYSIEMPVLARLHCDNLYINAGPYVNYTISGKVKTGSSQESPAGSTKISFGRNSQDFNRWEAGLMAGAGYNFHMGMTTLTLDARYGYGITSISRDIERYNRTFIFSVVVTSPCHKKQ